MLSSFILRFRRQCVVITCLAAVFYGMAAHAQSSRVFEKSLKTLQTFRRELTKGVSCQYSSNKNQFVPVRITRKGKIIRLIPSSLKKSADRRELAQFKRKAKQVCSSLTSLYLTSDASTTTCSDSDIIPDGNIDLFDLLVLLESFGYVGESEADISENGVVDLEDLLILLGCFGQTVTVPSTPTPSDAAEKKKTPTSTPIATFTSTPTISATVTSTATAISSNTPTRTPTNTATRTATSTSTIPSASTATSTPTRTSTRTATVTSTATPTSSSSTQPVMPIVESTPIQPPGSVMPIARWDVVPFDKIHSGQTFYAGVVGFSKPGIQKVVFQPRGQGFPSANCASLIQNAYTSIGLSSSDFTFSGSTVSVTKMAYNPDTNVWEYILALPSACFTSAGVILVDATVYGKDGGVRSGKAVQRGTIGQDGFTVTNHTQPLYDGNGVQNGCRHMRRINKTGAFQSSTKGWAINFHHQNDSWWVGESRPIAHATEDYIEFNLRDHGYQAGQCNSINVFQPASGDHFFIDDNLGLNTLVLNVQPQGTGPVVEAWVKVGGDDSTGQVNNSSKPFGSTRRAIAAILNYRQTTMGLGATVDGGKVYLLPGVHTANGSHPPDAMATSEWITITRDPSGTKENTVLQADYSVSNVQKVKLSGITLTNPSRMAIINPDSNFGYRAAVWVDDCIIVGPGKLYATGGTPNHPIGINFYDLYFTNTVIGDVNYGTPPVGTNLVRGVNIIHISNDGFASVPLIINSTVRDQSPIISAKITDAYWYRTGHPSNYNNVIVSAAFAGYQPPSPTSANPEEFRAELPNEGNITSLGKYPKSLIMMKIPGYNAIKLEDQTTSEFPQQNGPLPGWLQKNWHSDAIQYVKFNEWSTEYRYQDDNNIVYGFRGDELSYQGISHNSWVDDSLTNPAEGFAIVNALFNGSTYGSYLMREINHLLIWNTTFREKFLFDQDVKAGGARISTHITNLSIRSTVFGEKFIDALTADEDFPTDFIDYSDVVGNHFKHRTDFVNFNQNIDSDGDPQLDTHGRPMSNSPLLNKTNPSLTAADLEGTERSNPADRGALEAAN